MAEEVLGSGISKGVSEQLKLREDLIGRIEKNKDHLLFFNSNGAWVKLSSSVDTLTHAESIKFADFPEVLKTRAEEGKEFGDSTLASNNILFGGMYPENSKPQGGILSDKWHEPYKTDDKGYQKIISEGPQTGQRELVDTKLTSYHNYQSTGHRPVPGITSINVKSKNTYGTLREAEVSVVVWTLEDLELMQALYLRPGYTMLLEWGHSLGLDNTGIVKDITTFDKFFKSQQKQQTIESYLVNNAVDNTYNYDGMYGYVSNFSWSFRQDGGYDCTVKIISKGSILESLALCFDTGEVYPVDQITVGDEEATKEERRSPFHKFKLELSKVVIEPKSARGLQYPNANGPIGIDDPVLGNIGQGETQSFNVEKIYQGDVGRLNSGEDFSAKLNSSLYAFPVDYKTETSNEEGDTETIKGKKMYVPLSVILDIYNTYIALEDPTQEPQSGTSSGGYKYVQFYNGWQDKDTSPTNSFEKVSKFLTTKYHFSINPLICIIPGQLDNRGVQFQDPFNSCRDLISSFPSQNLPSTKNIGSIQINNFDLAVRSAFKQNELRGEKDDILNILISMDYVTSLLDTLIEEDKDSDQNISNNMTVFMQRLLKGINDSLGGVNDLDVTYDETENLFFIVDRRLTPANLKDVPEITLAGINSTLTNLNISSKISSNISSQISIAAQGGNQGTKDNIGPLLQWNRGLIDRHLPAKSPNKSSNDIEDKKRKEIERLGEWLKDYMEVWLPFKVNDRKRQTSRERRVGPGAEVLVFNTDAFLYNNFKILDETLLDNLTSLSAYHKIYCQKYVTEYYYKYKESPKPPPGVIPVELSFTTIGIAGFKVGQSFRFSKGILPKSYSDDFGFIITGLDHTIENNRWTTNVKTQFFCIQQPPQKVIDQYNELFECAPFIPEDEVPEATGVYFGVSREWWTLVAICYAENFSGNLQGYADVAQSIYNRANAPGGIYSGGDIVANILAPNQYEPTFRNKQDWANITTIDTAATAVREYQRARGGGFSSLTFLDKELKKCSAALQNTTYRQAAANFVGSRTEFLAYSPRSGNAVGAKFRDPINRNNVFFWNYGGKRVYYDTGNLSYTDFNIVQPPPEAVVL